MRNDEGEVYRPPGCWSAMKWPTLHSCELRELLEENEMEDLIYPRKQK